jgi:Uma2 family endonuclease
MPEVSDGIEEVVNGEIRQLPPPKWIHAEIVENLADAMRAQVDRQRIKIRISLFGLVIRKRPLTTRVPDLAVFDTATLVEQDGYIHSAPLLIVEVLSRANRPTERADKLADYAELGVPEVWVFSPGSRSVEVLLLENGAYRSSGEPAPAALTPTLLPSVRVEVAAVWPK